MRNSRTGHRGPRTFSGQAVTPRKSMGQNFLVDEALARWIADQIEPDGAPLLIEPGPGLGAMTRHLVGRPQHLLLIEKDDLLAPELQQRYAGQAVSVLHADATRVDKRPWYRHGEVKVVGNLPYSVGGEILKHLLTPPTPVTAAVFMLQKEVCERLAARLGEPGYGGLSVLIQQDWRVEMLRTIPPEAFQPRPKVDSGIVRFTPRDPASLPVYDRRNFERLVRLGFGQRRKQLKNLLPEAPGGWGALADALGLPATMRAEELSLAQWVDLARCYDGRHRGTDAGQKAGELFDVVNERNEVTGQLPRGEVHARGLLHRAVHVFVLNSRGEIFLQKRSHLKDVAPLKWDSSAAGHLDVGESYAACALRETREEIGLDIAATELAATLPAGSHTDFEFVELHLARHNGPVRCLPEEIATGEWFSPEQIGAWVAARPQDFAKGFVSCWQAYAARAAG